MGHLFEVCTGRLQSVEAAVRGGAQRIELCAALPLDGLTPSMGMLQTIRSLFPTLTVHVLIRSREGDFVYSEKEVLAMQHDIHAMLPFADGFVCGALTPDGGIDMPVMRQLIGAADGRPVTFHRAFDRCRDPLKPWNKSSLWVAGVFSPQGSSPRQSKASPCSANSADKQTAASSSCQVEVSMSTMSI